MHIESLKFTFFGSNSCILDSCTLRNTGYYTHFRLSFRTDLEYSPRVFQKIVERLLRKSTTANSIADILRQFLTFRFVKAWTNWEVYKPGFVKP